MNSLKNLMIIVVLAAVGYGVYFSLSRNSQPNRSTNASQGWPGGGLNVELPNTKTAISPLNTTGPAVSLTAPATTPAGVSALNGNSGVSPLSTSTMTAGPAVAMPGAAAPSSPGAMLNIPYESSPPSTVMNPAQPASASPAFGSVAATAVATGPASVTPAAGQATGDAARSFGPPDALSSAATTAQPATAQPAITPQIDDVFVGKFVAFMEEVQKTLVEGRLADAHLALSSLYNNPALPPLPTSQAEQLNKLLSELAGTVIYSRQHFLEQPYVTQPGDTLDRVAQQYNIPWQLLGKINGLLPRDVCDDNGAKDRPLPTGLELKVVRGPFDAIVDLGRHELTLFVQERYAGRFPIGVGHDQPSLEGSYAVREKTPNPAYQGPDGTSIGPGDPRNPLGSAWIALSDRVGIHGTANPQSIGRDDNRGSICVGENDIQDLYGILSVGSRVKIVR